MEPEKLMEEIKAICQFYANRGWDWRDPVLFTMWKDAGCPARHWTLNQPHG